MRMARQVMTKQRQGRVWGSELRTASMSSLVLTASNRPSPYEIDKSKVKLQYEEGFPWVSTFQHKPSLYICILTVVPNFYVSVRKRCCCLYQLGILVRYRSWI
jgi:hypothetical protein